MGLLERFEESLLLLKKLVAPELHLAYERRNTAEDDSVARRLRSDPESLARIRQMYAADLPLHAWVRDELWREYEQAYGPGLAEDAARLRADKFKPYIIKQ